MEAVSSFNEHNNHPVNPIDHWRKDGHWPKQFFEQRGEMDHLLAQKKLPPSTRQSESSVTPSDQKTREEKNGPYMNPSYPARLESKGSFMWQDKEGVSEKNKTICRTLLETDQTVPGDTLFGDELFEATCAEIQGRNEAKVIQDITRLIVPCARHLVIRGANHLDHLTESVNQGWNSSIPLFGSRPQPDYSVGFKRTACTEDQLYRIGHYIGDYVDGDRSLLMATSSMYFPFLTCEVKCEAVALEIADRQNAHSMTLAVRAIVEIFRYANREKEVHREILAFSVSHDDSYVRIYGHYPVIEGKETTFYRHRIRSFDFTELEGKDKWTAYKFTKNVYNTWMPEHFKRVCSVIDELPRDPELGFHRLSEGAGLRS